MHGDDGLTPHDPADSRDGVLVLCLGNDLLRDDGVGWAVADALEAGLSESRIFVKRSSLAGLYLLDELEGWSRAVVVDAVQTGAHAPGTVLSFPFEALGAGGGPSPHAVGLPSVVRLGRLSGVRLPAAIHVVAVEVDDMTTVSEGLTPAVRAAVPGAVRAVLSALDGRAGSPAGPAV